MHDLVFGARALEDIDGIHRYIADAADYDVADTDQARIIQRCRAIAATPLSGTPRDELMPGLRSAPFERRATIAYTVADDRVTIIRVFHAGRDIRIGFN